MSWRLMWRYPVQMVEDSCYAEMLVGREKTYRTLMEHSRYGDQYSSVSFGITELVYKLVR